MRWCLLAFGLISLYSCGESRIVNVRGEDLLLVESFDSVQMLQTEATLLEIDQDSFVAHGFYKEYYSTGSLKKQLNLHMGQRVGSSVLLYEDGSVNIYTFYSPEGELLYQVKFDKEGNQVEEGGRQNIYPHIVFLDDDLKIRIYAADIPHLGRDVVFSYESSGAQFQTKLLFEGDYGDYQVEEEVRKFTVTVTYADDVGVVLQDSFSVENFSRPSSPQEGSILSGESIDK